MSKTSDQIHVEPLDLAETEPSGIKDGVDVSAESTSWKSYIWDAWEKNPKERRLLLKLDLTITLFGFLGTIIKHIDRSNLTNAFVSGMKEDLHLYGNQMNYASTAFSIANIIGIWPVNLAMTRLNPRYFIPILEIGWAVVTFCQSAMKTPTQMYVLRVLVALFECGHFSAIMYIAGSWYQKGELSRRIALINCAVHIGPMFSSYLQTAAYKGLNGTLGRSGWQWVFIIDGIISLCIAIPPLFFFPDVPARQKPDRIFSESEIELARNRNPREGRVKQGAFTLAQIKRFVFTPEIWLLWIISVGNGIGNQPSGSMVYWLKAWNTVKPGSFTVPQINDYVTPIYAITVVLDLSFAWTSDTILHGRRWPMLVVSSTSMAIVCILLAATPVFPSDKSFRWFLYYMTGLIEASSTLFWAWTVDILSGDPAVRAFALGGLNLWSSVFGATIPLAVFQTVQQPAVVKGNWTAAGFCFMHSIACLVLAYVVHWKKRRASKEEGSTGSSEEGEEEL